MAQTGKKTGAASKLTFFIFLALVLGIIFGWLAPSIAVKMQPLADMFLRMVKMIIAPLIFATLVVGIAGHGDIKHLGKIGLKTIIYFEIVTTLALVLGLIMANVYKPGVGFNIDLSSVSMAAIEQDFHQARLIGSEVWVGKRWTIYMQGNKARILANKDLVWGYYFRRTGRNSVSEMRLFTKEKDRFGINLSEGNTQEALRIYGEEQPHMVIGYSGELEKMYNKDFNGFLELKYNPAARENEY